MAPTVIEINSAVSVLTVRDPSIRSSTVELELPRLIGIMFGAILYSRYRPGASDSTNILAAEGFFGRLGQGGGKAGKAPPGRPPAAARRLGSGLFFPCRILRDCGFG